MKPLSLILPAALAFSLMACNEVSAKAQPNQKSAQANQAPASYDEMAKDFAKMKEEFEVLKYGLEKRGLSIDDMRAEMEADNKVWDIPDDGSPVFGNTVNPKLTIVEFTEFQCPYCSRIAPVVKDLMDKHAGEIKFVYKNFPLSFHQNAKSAAAAAIAAQKQGKFWEYRYALAPHNSELGDSIYVEVAKQVGLNIEQFNKDREMTEEMSARIQKDFDLGAKVGVQGTPNFYINGKRQDRFNPQLVEQMLKEAK